MNAAAKGLIQQQYLEGRLIAFVVNPQMWVLLATVVLVFASAFAVVYQRDSYRRYTSELQVMQQQLATLKTEHHQLVIEQSAWSNVARIQQVAERRLGMQIPDRVVTVRR